MKLSTFLKGKDQKVMSVGADNTVSEAVLKMLEHAIGSLVVICDDGKLCGIITERDLLTTISQGADPKEEKVAKYMSKELVTVTPETTVMEGLAIMTERHIRRLPVVEANELVGILTIGDLVKKVAEDQESHISYLEDVYLRGPYRC